MSAADEYNKMSLGLLKRLKESQDHITDLSREIVRVRTLLLETNEKFNQEMAERIKIARQITTLAQFIMDEVPGEPSENQGAVETIIRVVREQQQWETDLLTRIPNELLDDTDNRDAIEKALQRLLDHWLRDPPSA